MATIKGLAKATGYSIDAIRLRVRRFGLPRDFDPKAVVKLAPLDEDHDPNKTTLEEARTELALEDAKLKRATRKNAEGRLADIEEVLEEEGAFLNGIARIIKNSKLEPERKQDIAEQISGFIKRWAERRQL